MILLELFQPEVLEDYDTIFQTMRDAGYTELGAGADASVWTKDVGTVIKIIVPQDGPTTKAIETFKKFYEFCMQHQDIPCLPRFINIQGRHYSSFKIKGQTFLQIAMEQLYPIKNDSFDEGIVWLFSHFVSTHEPWARVDELLGYPDTWYDYNEKFANRYAQKWQNLSMIAGNQRKHANYQLLYSVMELLYKTGTINNMGWDLHTENVMQRRNGQLVIIDPWFNWNGGTGR